MDLCPFLGEFQQSWIDERTRVDDDIRSLKKLLPLDCDELGVACPRANNVHLHILPPVTHLPCGRK